LKIFKWETKIETLVSQNSQIDFALLPKYESINEKSSSSLLPSNQFDHGRERQRKSWRWNVMVEQRP